jgi:hypothetical protein
VRRLRRRDEQQLLQSKRESSVSAAQSNGARAPASVTEVLNSSDLKVQLAGHASIERAAGDPGYNDRLSERRVRLILNELDKRRLDGARLGNPPDTAIAPGCRELSAGLLACCDNAASGTPSPHHRNVTASTFAPGEQAAALWPSISCVIPGDRLGSKRPFATVGFCPVSCTLD